MSYELKEIKYRGKKIGTIKWYENFNKSNKYDLNMIIGSALGYDRLKEIAENEHKGVFELLDNLKEVVEVV